MNNCESEPSLLRLREHETCRTTLLNEAQRMVLAQHFSKYLAVTPTWIPGECQLTARQYVGTIVLDSLHIVIRPKVPLDNLFYMLTYAYELPQFRKEITSLAISEDLFEFVVTIFVQQVEQLVRQGIYRSYIDLEDDHRYLRGRLLLPVHLQRNAVHAHRFHQRTNEYTADVLENHILKSTLSLLSRLDYRDPALNRHIRRTLSAFSEITLLPIAPNDCNRVVYTRLNAGYRSPIHLAHLLLQNLSIEGRSGETPFVAYLLDMNQVFELFVARYLESHFTNSRSLEVAIQDDIWLDAEQKEKGIPDIVLRWDGRPYLILDTKYKEFSGQPSSADRNQMLVYCQTLGLSSGMLIYANDQPVNFDRVYQPATHLSARTLSLRGPLSEFRHRCREFADQFLMNHVQSGEWNH